MGNYDFGSQKQTFTFNQEAASKQFNALNHKLLPSGIYDGFKLTKLNNASINISRGICVVEDDGVSIRVETELDQGLAVSNATPYIVFRYRWQESPDNYMDMLAVSFDNIEADDLIIGRCIYDSAGQTLNETFDYTRRSVQYLDKNKKEQTYFKVYPTEPISNKVLVTGGIINSSKGNVIVQGGEFPSGGLPNTTLGRIDLICITEDGEIEIVTGTDKSNPEAPRYGSRKVVAEIRRGSGRSNVIGTDIVSVISSFDSTPIPSDLLLEDVGDFYSQKNVEDALQDLGGRDYTFKGEKTFDKIAKFIKSIFVRGEAGKNIAEFRKSNDELVCRLSSSGKFINDAGAEIALNDIHSVFTTDDYESALNQLGGSTMTIKGTKTFINKITGTIQNADNATNANHASTADTLKTTRKIGGVNFNGSKDINLPGVNTSGNQNTSGKASTAGTADKLVTGNTGANNLPVYFEDGKPKVITSYNGKSASTTKLASSVTIGGKSFDGTQNITFNDLLPKGFIYTQYPGQSSPMALFGGGVEYWEDITTQYAGLFFRADGKNAKAFGEGEQGDAIRDISGEFSAQGTSTSTDYDKGSFSTKSYGRVDGGNSQSSSYPLLREFNPAKIAGVNVANEFRPVNVSIKIWKKIK